MTQPPTTTLRLCSDCRHRRSRAPLDLFGDRPGAPAVLKEQTTMEQEDRQRAQQEYQAFTARQPFRHKPYAYAWCAFHSHDDEVAAARTALRQGDAGPYEELRRRGHVVLNPVTGEYSQLYVLCAWMNPEGACAQHEPLAGSTG